MFFHRHPLASLAFAFLFATNCFSQVLGPGPAHETSEVQPGESSFSSSRSGVDALMAASEAEASGSSTESAVRGSRSGGVSQIAPAGHDPWLFAHYGAGVFISPLGLGVGAATTITSSTNLRLSGNFFTYSLNESIDGVAFTGNADFHSVQGSIDWFPWHGRFHVSPGVLFYNQNQVSAVGSVPAGDSFTLNDTTYYSGSADPVHGNGTVNFRKTAPMLTVGWGNWIPRRREKHLSFPFEVGFAYTGDPRIKLNLAGVVCDAPSDNVDCRAIDSDPTVQQNINEQIKKVQNDLNLIRFYPIISGGVAYKF
jgi:hypothetical protein